MFVTENGKSVLNSQIGIENITRRDSYYCREQRMILFLRWPNSLVLTIGS